MAKNRDGTAEIHVTTVHKVSARWSTTVCLRTSLSRVWIIYQGKTSSTSVSCRP